MKYLKKFNENVDQFYDEYYQEIELDEYVELRNTSLQISDTEFNKIKDILDTTDTKFFKITKWPNSVNVHSEDQGISSFNEKKDMWTDIYILKDEYYIIRIGTAPNRFYKCDQFDGLKKFISNYY